MVGGAVQWLSQGLVTLVRLRRPRSALGALALPPEIILMVATYLTNPSVISLALTCRTLHHLCFPGRSHLNTAETEELLLFLEKDIATLYFCHYCAKLHRWHTRWANSTFPWVKGLPCQESLKHCLFLPYKCDIPYHHARLVMNRHFYGPSHGLPPHKLEKRICFTSSGGVTDSESLRARIVDDKLLVLLVRTLYHSRGDSKTLRGYVDSRGNSACKHLTLRKGCPDFAPLQLPELAKDKTTPDHFAPCDQSFGSCTFCLTDYCIDISWRGKKKGYAIKVSSYHQLGDCRSPFDWSWRTISTRLTNEEPRTAYPVEYRPGSVRDRWNRAAGIVSRTYGEWVEVPGLAPYRRELARVAVAL
ncbi:hypothetical protein CC80DRAFT_554111 [Byssothecium circinans]|uniref:F-box domain-containing protein n=1 Tax=Byssothecium circinans TaxID=147558 RepID=A0A6A5TIX6_9PLEO|nr:hypothetical protein CC80DRAFT_554111 [Byssothecium circinans]